MLYDDENSFDAFKSAGQEGEYPPSSHREGFGNVSFSRGLCTPSASLCYQAGALCLIAASSAEVQLQKLEAAWR